MRKIVLLLIIVVILPAFTLKSSAEDGADGYIYDFESILPEGLEGICDPDKIISSVGIDGLLSAIVYAISDGKADLSGFLLTLLGCTALISLSSLYRDRLSTQVQGVVGIICSVVVFGSVRPVIDSVSMGVSELSSFFASLIPITVGLTSLGGAVTTASVQATGMYTALSAVSGIGCRIFLSMSSFGLAMSLASAVGTDAISSVCKGLRALFNWVTGIFTALLTAAFSLQTLVASSSDSASMRAVKYAASGLIPVVGSTVSGAISTLASGVAYAKSIVGVGAVAVIIYMAISPLVLLLLYRLALSLSIILADFSGGGVASRIFTSYRFRLPSTPFLR